MSPRVRRSLLLAFALLLIVGALASCSSCSKKAEPTPPPADVAQAQPGGQIPGGAAAPGGNPPALQASPKCRAACKSACMRGRQCNLPGYNNVLRCGRFCLALCSRGMVPDSLETCMKPENDCNQVSKCLTDLRAGVIKQIQEMKARRETDQATPEQNPPAEAPANQ